MMKIKTILSFKEPIEIDPKFDVCQIANSVGEHISRIIIKQNEIMNEVTKSKKFAKQEKML